MAQSELLRLTILDAYLSKHDTKVSDEINDVVFKRLGVAPYAFLRHRWIAVVLKKIDVFSQDCLGMDFAANTK